MVSVRDGSLLLLLNKMWKSGENVGLFCLMRLFSRVFGNILDGFIGYLRSALAFKCEN